MRSRGLRNKRAGNAHAKSSRQLRLNVARIVVPDATIQASVVPYDPESGHLTLAELRKDHRGTHAFARTRDGIICLPRTENSPTLAPDVREFDLGKNLSLVGALLRESLIDHFHGLGRTVVGYRPISFLANSRYDLLREPLLERLHTPTWLSVVPRYALEVRLFFFGDRPPFLGIALDTRIKKRIVASCAEILEEGIDLRGLYVGSRQQGDDPRVQSRFSLLGRVAQVDNGKLVLVDTRDEVNSVCAEEVFPEESSRAFSVLARQVFGDQAEAAGEIIFQRAANRRVGPAKLSDIERLCSYLSSQEFQVGPKIKLGVEAMLDGRALPKITTAPKPIYVLDPTGAKTHTWADGGIKQYGPYSRKTFSKNRPRITVICLASAKGRVEQFLQKFFYGQRHPKKPNGGPFDNGLVGKYCLEDVSTKFFLAAAPTSAAYQQAARSAIESVATGSLWDLALVQIEGRFKELEGGENPYLVTKHEFLTHQIPAQEFTLETADLWEGQLAYALNNMALATYSKLGGTPWLLQCDRTIAHELVIGIGSANIGEGRLGDRERVVGFTTVFSGDGNYRVANRSKAVRNEEYSDALLATLQMTIETVSRDMNWQSGDHVRLIFHSSFKRFRKTEVTAVKGLVDSLATDYDVDLAFLEVNTDHAYLVFDEAQAGAKDYATRRQKGALAPDRGMILSLSRYELLLVLTGPRDVKRPEDGLPSPVLLRLHRDSTFTDMTYLARQVFAFANHSWRSFFPGSMPVTVHYSNLIAGLLGELGRLPNWNPSVLVGRIGSSRWFL